MKKKSLNAKLSIHKNTIALLNQAAQHQVQGGQELHGGGVSATDRTLIVTCPIVASKPCGSEVDPFTCLSIHCPPTSQMIGC